jgi:hypothetical protein
MSTWPCQPSISRARSGNPIPDEEHDDGADGRSDKAGTLVGGVPTNSLADERGQESAHDAHTAVRMKPDSAIVNWWEGPWQVSTRFGY